MYLRMAWGSGCRGMTGNWLQNEHLSQFRVLNQKLGKPDAPVFPKTRRLALQDGIPCLPPGWVQVIVLPASHFQQKARLVQAPPAALPTNASAAAPASPPTAAATPEPQSAEIRTTEGQASETQASESRPSEIWRGVLITWNAGSGGIATITGPDDKRVEIKTRSATETLIPVACHSTLFHKKKRKATFCNIGSFITLDPEFENMLGFTQAEVDALLRKREPTGGQTSFDQEPFGNSHAIKANQCQSGRCYTSGNYQNLVSRATGRNYC